jgi:hypothetical protein
MSAIYRPDTERWSHYAARRSRQFDAAVHVDVTTALQPLRTRLDGERRAQAADLSGRHVTRLT